jgi:hypothetical protein
MTKINYAESDYETIRDNLYEMLADAKEALELSKEILKESEHPRAVEVYSGLLSNIVKLNAQILDLSKTFKDINERKSYKDAGNELPSSGEPAQIQNFFVGETSDLQRMFKEMEKEKELIELNPDSH